MVEVIHLSGPIVHGGVQGMPHGCLDCGSIQGMPPTTLGPLGAVPYNDSTFTPCLE